MSAPQTAGIASRLTRCEKHGNEYSQIWFGSQLEGLWVGQCDECKEEEKFEQRAREILTQRKVEVDRQVFAEMREHDEKAILEQAEDELSAQLEKWREEFRPQFIANVRAALHEQVTFEVEQEFLDKIEQELRKEKK